MNICAQIQRRLRDRDVKGRGGVKRGDARATNHKIMYIHENIDILLHLKPKYLKLFHNARFELINTMMQILDCLKLSNRPQYQPENSMTSK